MRPTSFELATVGSILEELTNFRHGHLGVGIGQTVDQAVDNAMSEQALYDRDIGDGLDGFMDFEELKTHLLGLLEFPTGLLVENENPRLADRKAVENLTRSRLAD